MISLGGLSAVYPGQQQAQKLDQQNQLDKFKITDAQTDQAGQVAFGNTLKMFQQQVPGAQPMQGPMNQGGQQPPGQQSQSMPQQGGQTPMPGQPSMPMRPPQQPMGGQPQMQGNPQQGAGMGGGGMPQQQPQGQPQQGGQQQGGQLDWKQIAQKVSQANPGAPPQVLAAAVSKFLPLMTQQAQMEWKQVQLALMGQRNEDQSRDRNRGMDVRESEGSANRGSREGIAQGNRVSRETISKMTVDERREAHEAGIISREQMDEANRGSRESEGEKNRGSREGISGTRADISREAEAGRAARSELSNTTKRDLAQLSDKAKREIAAARLDVEGVKEEGRDKRFVSGQEGQTNRTLMREKGQDLRERDRQGALDDRAKLSDETRREIARLGADSRKELTEYLEAGRQTRAAQSDTTRRDISDANRSQRESASGRAEEGRNTRAGQAESGRQSRFGDREQRLSAAATVRQDQGYQKLELQKQSLADRITKGGDRNALSQWRAIVDAQHKRALEIIQANSGMSALDPKEKKALLDEQSKSYRLEIEGMKRMMQGKGGGESSAAPGSLPPEAIKGLQEGHITEFNNGQKWTLKNGQPEQVP